MHAQSGAGGLSRVNDFIRHKANPGRIPFGKSKWWEGIGEGIYPEGIACGPRVTVWPTREIDALVIAITAGASKDELRALSRELMAMRGDPDATDADVRVAVRRCVAGCHENISP